MVIVHNDATYKHSIHLSVIQVQSVFNQMTNSIPMQPSSSNKAQIQKITNAEGVILFNSSGDWTLDCISEVFSFLEIFSTSSQIGFIQWNVSNVNNIDSAGMILFIHYFDLLKSKGYSITMEGVKKEHNQLYQLLRKYTVVNLKQKTADVGFLNPLTHLGKNTVTFVSNGVDFLSFIGENFVTLLHSIRHPRSIRYDAVVKNIEEAGLKAVPIIALTSFLIGVVIAYQGAVQLEKFGANIFIVDMIGVSITRELAPLITAIVVAGRTGSSYTAQLGVMKITDEIDAMRTMGFEPQQFLVLPRILALMLVLPLMIFFADIIGIAAGMLISHVHLHISYAEFINRLQSVLEIKHVWIGLSKGPVFAWLIASVGCFNGFQVSKNTESIGQNTTTSVVNAIFLVIACDALFSVILTELGI